MYTITGEIQYSQGTSPKGEWKKAVFEISDGKEVIVWSTHPDFATLKTGGQVSGDLTRGEYKGKVQWTLKALNKPSSFRAKPNEIKAAVKEKNEGIERAQGRKEDSIKLAGSQRDAILLVTTFYTELAKLPIEDREEAIKVKINAWRNWLIDEFPNESVPF